MIGVLGGGPSPAKGICSSLSTLPAVDAFTRPLSGPLVNCATSNSPPTSSSSSPFLKPTLAATWSGRSRFAGDLAVELAVIVRHRAAGDAWPSLRPR